MAWLYVIIIIIFLAGLIAIGLTMDKEEDNKED